MHLIKRIGIEIRTRGPIGFLHFIRRRIWQYREDVLFEMRLPAEGNASRASRLDHMVIVNRKNYGSLCTASVERDVLTEPNFAYRKALMGEDVLYAATDPSGGVSTYGFVLFESFYKRVLGEKHEVPMIGNCFTFPLKRRLGLYANLLVSICSHLAENGYSRVIITCAPDNLASVRGIQNAGFSRLKTLGSVVVFSRWIVFQRNISQ